MQCAPRVSAPRFLPHQSSLPFPPGTDHYGIASERNSFPLSPPSLVPCPPSHFFHILPIISLNDLFPISAYRRRQKKTNHNHPRTSPCRRLHCFTATEETAAWATGFANDTCLGSNVATEMSSFRDSRARVFEACATLHSWEEACTANTDEKLNEYEKVRW